MQTNNPTSFVTWPGGAQVKQMLRRKVHAALPATKAAAHLRNLQLKKNANAAGTAKTHFLRNRMDALCPAASDSRGRASPKRRATKSSKAFLLYIVNRKNRRFSKCCVEAGFKAPSSTISSDGYGLVQAIRGRLIGKRTVRVPDFLMSSPLSEARPVNVIGLGQPRLLVRATRPDLPHLTVRPGGRAALSETSGCVSTYMCIFLDNYLLHPGGVENAQRTNRNFGTPPPPNPQKIKGKTRTQYKHHICSNICFNTERVRLNPIVFDWIQSVQSQDPRFPGLFQGNL